MSRDRYKYFRVEAREIMEGLTASALAAEKGDVAAVARLMRLAHTLKGASRVVGLVAIADQAHAIEEHVGPHREAASLPVAEVAFVLQAVDACNTVLAGLDAPVVTPASLPAAQPPPARALEDEPIETVRVALTELDRLLESLAASAVALRGLRGRLATAEPGALAALDRASAELERAQAEARELRLVPADRIFLTLERAVRDAAGVLNKRVSFAQAGGDVRLDGHVLAGVRDALMHAVRNAVDHGLEPESERLAKGKPAIGTVTVRVESAGGHAKFTCADDGRGLDPQALRQAAASRGRLDAEAAARLSDDAALELVFLPGFSTRDTVSAVSGRGVGLDVVRDMTRRLEGTVRLANDPGRGLKLELTVPLSLAAMNVVAFEALGHPYAIPLDQVRRVLKNPGHGLTLDDQGQEIPLVTLAALARLPGAFAASAGPAAALVLEAGGARLALGVDALHGTTEVVVKPLPAMLAGLTLVTGAAFDADGTPWPVLDARALIAAALQHPELPPAPAQAALLPILVIDDSLTTRMLEQSILLSAGYEVQLAIHAEQGLEFAQRKPYGLFIVDVEMPGMSGYDFVALTRRDPVLSRIPAVLVTSLGGPTDRARGIAAGASDYIVKGEFDQNEFLATVQRLLGRPVKQAAP